MALASQGIWSNRDMRFWVRIYRQGKDYSAMVPDLPGCVAAADSVEQVRGLTAEAIRMHLDLMLRSGEKMPNPTRHIDLDVEELEKGEICTWVDIKTGLTTRRKTGVGS